MATYQYRPGQFDGEIFDGNNLDAIRALIGDRFVSFTDGLITLRLDSGGAASLAAGWGVAVADGTVFTASPGKVQQWWVAA